MSYIKPLPIEIKTDYDLYRVSEVAGETPRLIRVELIGASSGPVIGKTVVGEYEDINDLPEWMKRKIAVLSMVTPSNANIHDGVLVNVGRRVDDTIFYVYRYATDR